MEQNKVLSLTEDQKLHLQFIQGVIARMNSNSNNMKGWSVAISAAILVLLLRKDDDVNASYMWIAAIPNILFWCLDTFYLMTERKYRLLYDKVVKNDGSVPPFNMDIHDEKVSYYKTLFRPVEVAFYLPIIVGVILGSILV